VPEPQPWVYDDGGRAAAGRKGDAGDCAVRAIAIAAELPYADIYDALYDASRLLDSKPASPRLGVTRKVMDGVLVGVLGWSWTPTMQVGSGTRVHLRADELPDGRLIARCSRHYVAVIDGVAHDTHDPTRDGTRAVYGYWTR
jgi:hypothetical protein